MPINKNELSEEMIKKAMQCKTAEELMELAKTAGISMTLEEAAAYLANLTGSELVDEQLKKVAGGVGCNINPFPRC